MLLECDETNAELLGEPAESFSDLLSQIFLRYVSQNKGKMDEVPKI